MGFMDKVMFWKKDDFSDLGLDKGLGKDLGLGAEPGKEPPASGRIP